MYREVIRADLVRREFRRQDEFVCPRLEHGEVRCDPGDVTRLSPGLGAHDAEEHEEHVPRVFERHRLLLRGGGVTDWVTALHTFQKL